MFLVYWAVVLASMKSVVDKYKLDYLLRSRHSYTPAQRAALAANRSEHSVADIAMYVSALMENNAHVYDSLIPGISVTLAEQVLTATIKNEKFFQVFYEVFQYQFMGAVSMTCLIIIATTVISVLSRFTSCKANYFATYIQNRDSHYEVFKTHADKCYSEMSKATILVGVCKNISWLQVSCTVAFSTSAIIESYEANKNHLISHVPDNNIDSRSGSSIGQVG